MSNNSFIGKIVDPINNRIYSGEIIVKDGKIHDIIEKDVNSSYYILPGFIDSHVHIESSMLTPCEFSRIAVTHGTIGAVCDPHEIANVLGVDGVKFMYENGKTVPFYFLFSAPSCVPATPFETSGAVITPDDIEELFKKGISFFLGEVMNFPGVINGDKDLMEKMNMAKEYNLPIDGHAPALVGDDLTKYINCGITTDHESFMLSEAKEKIEKGMKIIIREGSAAKNFDTLAPLIDDHWNMCMFCSDDKHPDDLLKGHINDMVKRSVKMGIDIMKILHVSSVNPVKHYSMDTGLLQIGDNADFIIVDNIEDLNILQTVIKGETVYSNEKKNLFVCSDVEIVNNFNTNYKIVDDFKIKMGEDKVDIIEAIDGQIFTKIFKWDVKKDENGYATCDIENDIIKISVVNRYENAKPAVWFVKGFGLKDGAIASSVAHDSHNIVVIGTNDEDICNCVNLIMENKGGLCVVSSQKGIKNILPLPIAGIMTNRKGEDVEEDYIKIDKLAKDLGCTMHAPFMTLSFMALLVIPEIKIGDKGVFKL